MPIAAVFGRPTVAGEVWRWRSPPRLQAYATIAAISFAGYILAHLLTGGVATAFAVVGVGACGWAWLLARALFDPAPHDVWWPRVSVLVLIVAGALSVLAPAGGAVVRIADNAYVLSGSAALLLTFVEPFNRYGRDLSASEKRFRLLFLAIYGLLVAVSVLDLVAGGETAEAARRDDLIKALYAALGMAAAMAAVGFRLRHPLAHTTVSRRRPASAEDRSLADRLLRLIEEQNIAADPDLRIADVAARLNEPEHKVSQCITAVLGFANFNRLINHHRIEHARARLAAAEDRGSILEIAFDCGFGSIGPFNRAFKDQVGTTPSAFRAERRRSLSDLSRDDGG